MPRLKLQSTDDLVLTLDADGTILKPEQAERFAVALADDDPQAWKSAGGAESQTQIVLRTALEQHPDFLRRVAHLRAEKASLEGDPIFGQAIWMVGQLFRACRANKDRDGMKEATRMRVDIAKSHARLAEKSLNPAESPPPEAKTPGNVGRPVADSPQSKQDIGSMRLKLIQKGIKLDPPEEDDEA